MIYCPNPYLLLPPASAVASVTDLICLRTPGAISLLGNTFSHSATTTICDVFFYSFFEPKIHPSPGNFLRYGNPLTLLTTDFFLIPPRIKRFCCAEICT